MNKFDRPSREISLLL